jgi:mRNA interferase MazF
LAPATHSEWIVCQVTGNPFADPIVIEITDASFSSGNLRGRAYARPLKLFTADSSIVTQRVGALEPAVFRSLIEPLLNALSRSLLT